MNTDPATYPNGVAPPARLLVAEDDEVSRNALVRLLERDGYQVMVAKDGLAALEIMCAPNPPQIALLDWEMPRLNGIDVCRTVRCTQADSYTYIVMVTAKDQPRDALAAFEAGVDDFLGKPIDGLQLLARLRCGKRVLASEKRCEERIADLEKVLGEVRALKRLLPICMYCKKVRDDADYWHEIEAHIREQTGTDFSHGICPGCMEGVRKRDMPEDPVARAGRQMSKTRSAAEAEV